MVRRQSRHDPRFRASSPPLHSISSTPEPHGFYPLRDLVSDMAIEDYLRKTHRIPYPTPLDLHALPDTLDPRPTTAALMQLAIWGSPDRRLTLSQIYAAIETRYEDEIPKAMRNTIRHDLSKKAMYKKESRPATNPGTGSLWCIDADNLGNARARPPGRRRRRRSSTARLRGVSSAMEWTPDLLPYSSSSSSQSDASPRYMHPGYLPTPTPPLPDEAYQPGIAPEGAFWGWDAERQGLVDQYQEPAFWSYDNNYEGPSSMEPPSVMGIPPHLWEYSHSSVDFQLTPVYHGYFSLRTTDFISGPNDWALHPVENMDNNPVVPLVDEKNPLYCPALPADAYLQSLRKKISMRGTIDVVKRDQDLSHTFTQVLGRSDDNDDDSEDDRENTFAMLGSHLTLGASRVRLGHTFGRSPVSENLPPYSPINLLRAQSTVRKDAYATANDRPTPGVKRKSLFSDLEAPPKYARSLDSFHDSSFDIENRHEKLQYGSLECSPRASQVLKSKDAFASTNDDLGALIGRLECIYPGIRLRERLENLQAKSAQELVDFLGEQGYLNERVLVTFQHTGVTRILFSPSMIDANGLNLIGDEIFSVFSTFQSFRNLVELSFAYIRVQDSHIVHIHHLPNLAVLDLNETGIGNEGVFLLVPLKLTLTRLLLTANTDIGNDAVAAILLLNNLSFLSILDTGIDMVGLRRLAKHMADHGHVMDIEIPYTCELYVDEIAAQYALDLPPPLLSDWKICGQLTAGALKRNLEAHAAVNPSILASGTRAEMLHRLSDLLKMRQLDMLVMGMLNGGDGHH